MHIASIVGARPNFVKVGPIVWELARHDHVRHSIIHTGQHYDTSMSESFFDILNIPRPDINLEVGSAGHGAQTGRIMIALEQVLEEMKADWLVIVGDVNSTVAAALVATKLGIRVAHVEAGLRSNDRGMPEEINRLASDAISDLLLVTEQSGLDNLRREGVPQEKIEFTGNVMIDSLAHVLPKARAARAWERYDKAPGEYLLVTLHRPSNVDHEDVLRGLVEALASMSDQRPVLFPVHPRTRRNLEHFGLMDDLVGHTDVLLVDPLDYLSFLSLVIGAHALVTDSGGIQEETTYLGIPCMTLRPNTERPVTIDLGTNELIRPERDAVLEAFERLQSGRWKQGQVPPLWDGRAATRIVKALLARSGR